MTQLASAPSNIVPDDDLPEQAVAPKVVPIGDLHPQHIQAMAVPDDDLPEQAVAPSVSPPTQLATPSAAPETTIHTLDNGLITGHPRFPGYYTRQADGYRQVADASGARVPFEKQPTVPATDFESVAPPPAMENPSGNLTNRPRTDTWGQVPGQFAASLARHFVRPLGDEDVFLRHLGLDGQMDEGSNAGNIGGFVGDVVTPPSIGLGAATGGIGKGIAGAGASSLAKKLAASAVAGGLYTGTVGTAQRAAHGETPTPLTVAKDVAPGIIGGVGGELGGAAVERAATALPDVARGAARFVGGIVSGGASNVAAGAAANAVQGQPVTENAAQNFIAGAAAHLPTGIPEAVRSAMGPLPPNQEGGNKSSLNPSGPIDYTPNVFSENPYVRLGVTPGATPEQIHKAYRERIATFHPDTPGGDHDTASLINQAKNLLLDPELREAFDKGGMDAVDQVNAARRKESRNENATPAAKPAADTGATPVPAPTEAPSKAQVRSGAERIPSGDDAERVAEAKPTAGGGNGSERGEGAAPVSVVDAAKNGAPAVLSPDDGKQKAGLKEPTRADEVASPEKVPLEESPQRGEAVREGNPQEQAPAPTRQGQPLGQEGQGTQDGGTDAGEALRTVEPTTPTYTKAKAARDAAIAAGEEPKASFYQKIMDKESAKPATITPEGAADAGRTEAAQSDVRGGAARGGGRRGEQAATEGGVRADDESGSRSAHTDKRAASIEGIKRGIAPFKGVSLHDDGTNLHIHMPDGSRVPTSISDRMAPEPHHIEDYLASARAENKGGRWFTEGGGEYAIPQDKAGWDKLPDNEKRVILDTFRTYGRYDHSNDSISLTHHVAQDHSIAGEEVFHALSRRLKNADRDTYNKMMTKYDSEDDAFRAFSQGKSRAEYFKRIREGTAHEPPSSNAGSRYLSPKQKAEATLISAAKDEGVLMSDNEFESFVNDRGGLHPDVLDDYKLRDANGKPRLNDKGEKMYTKEGNILKNFVNEGAHSDITADMSPAKADQYQQRIVNELLMKKAEKVRMAAEHFASNPYAHPELRAAAEKILGKQVAPAEDNEPAPFATRREEDNEENARRAAEALVSWERAHPEPKITTESHQPSNFAQKRDNAKWERARADKLDEIRSRWPSPDSVLEKHYVAMLKEGKLTDKTTGPQQSLLGERSEGFGIGSKSGKLFGDTSEGPANAVEDTRKATPTDKDQGSLFAVRRSAEAAGASKDEIEDARKQWAEKGTESPYFKKWFGESKTVDADGKPKVMYHGTSRPDRIGEKFRPDRATSGPMQYFTDDSGIGSNYAAGKADTSLEQPADYADWFKFKPKGSRSEVNIEQAWHHLSSEERASIAEKLPHVTSFDKDNNESGTIRLGDRDEYGLAGKDHWAYEIRQARGNVLKAAKEIWLNGANRVGIEHEFLDVLDKAGMKGVRLDDPQARNPAVLPTYLSIKNPLVTSNIPPDVMNALDSASRRTRAKVASYGADAWDKNTRNPAEWMRQLKEDYAKKENSFVWTSVPDWVTKTLREKGYDGIQDTGGKMGGQVHNVWVPFDPEQIKSATGNRGTFDENNANINFATRRRSENEPSELAKTPEKPEDEDTRPDPTLFGKEYDRSATSNNNAAVDKERAQRGLPPMMQEVERSFSHVAAEANREIDLYRKAQDELIEKLRDHPRPVTDKENYMLLQRRVDLHNQRDRVAREMIQAKESGDQGKVVEARLRTASISDQLQELDTITRKTGTELGRGLNARRMMMNEDYSLAAMETRKRTANDGRPLTEKESAHIEELQKKIADTQKAFDEYVKNNENRARRARAKDATAKIIASASSPRRPLAVLDAEERSILAGLRQRVASLRDTMGGSTFAVRGEGEESEPTSAHSQDDGPATDWSTIPNLSKIVHDLAKNQVERGIRDRDTLVDAVHGKLKDILKGFSRDDTVDAISGYGKFKPLSKDEINVTLRDLKGQLQQEAKLRDMTEKGLAPLKTGLERRLPSDEERRLIQQVNDTMKKLGITTSDPETEHKSALDSVKTRLKNQISDLDYQIATGEKTVRTKTPSPSDAEVETLRARRDELQKLHDAMFADPKMTDADRIKLAIKAAEKTSAEYERRVKDNQPFTPAKPDAPTSPELEAARARRDATKEELQYLRDVAGVDANNARKVEAIQKSIAEVEQKIRDKELATQKTAQPSTPEIDALNRHRDLIQKTLDRMRADAAKKPLSQVEAEAFAKRVKQLQDAIAGYSHKIAQKTPAKKATPKVESPEIEALKKQRLLMAKTLMKIRNEAKPRKTPEEIAQQAFKTRTANRIAELTERLAKKDYAPSAPRPKLQLDAEAQALEANKNRIQQQFQHELIRDRLKKRTPFEKAADALSKWTRAAVLSSPTIIAKLSTAAVLRGVTTPMEEAIGGVLSHIIPGVASRAPREGGFSAKAEGLAIAEGLTTGIKQSWKVLKTGHSDLDAIFGKQNHMPPSYLDYVTNLHGALHTPTQYSEFARSLQKRTEFAIRAGLDPTDPATQLRLMNESYKDSLRSVFRQDNRVSDAFNRVMSGFGQADKNTGHATIAGKIAETAGHVALPVTKVPTNIAGEVFQYATGAATGSARLTRAFVAGFDKLNPDEADHIMRSLKKGSLGLAVLALGYFSLASVGGFFQKGEKRDPGDVAADDLKLFGVSIPGNLVHHPLYLVLQMGATIARVSQSLLHKSDDAEQGVSAGVMAAAMGVVEEVPYVREITEIDKFMDANQRDRVFGDKLRSVIVPHALSWAAQQGDKDESGNPVPRKPSGVFENIEMGIPGLRNSVPTDEKKARRLAHIEAAR